MTDVPSGAYRAMIERAAVALVFESAEGFTPAEARSLAAIVYESTLNDLARVVDEHAALYDRSAEWRDGVEEAAQLIRTLATGDSEAPGGAR